MKLDAVRFSDMAFLLVYFIAVIFFFFIGGKLQAIIFLLFLFAQIKLMKKHIMQDNKKRSVGALNVKEWRSKET